jgi:hypothetical protein
MKVLKSYLITDLSFEDKERIFQEAKAAGHQVYVTTRDATQYMEIREGTNVTGSDKKADT